jgi:hypothetical protein
VGQLLRTVGFSSAPGVIQSLGVIPVLAEAVFFAAWVWMLVAMVIAVRQALDYESTARAVGVCLIGWGLQMVFLGAILPSNSQFEFLGGVEREVAVEALEHEGKEMRPTGKTEIARQRAQIIKEGLPAH